MIAQRRSGTSRSAVCIGGACIDHKYTALSAIRPGTSNPSASGRSFGGVARNMTAVETLCARDVEQRWNAIASAGWLFVDCNVSAGVLQHCAALTVESAESVRTDLHPHLLEGVWMNA